MKAKMKSQPQKTIEFIIVLALSIIGVIFLFLSINMMISNNNFKKENTKVIATVTDSNSVNKYTAVSFYIDDKEYNAIAKKYSSKLKPGDKITIFYNKENPNDIIIEDENSGAGGFLGLGIILLAVGLSIILHKLNNSVNKDVIIKTGKRIEADLEDVVYNVKSTANGNHPYYVVCTWKNKTNGKTYTYKSENLWYDPKPQIKKSGLDKIPVYILPSNPSKYYVAMEEVNSSNKSDE